MQMGLVTPQILALQVCGACSSCRAAFGFRPLSICSESRLIDSASA
jgi:hypothetical protein